VALVAVIGLGIAAWPHRPTDPGGPLKSAVPFDLAPVVPGQPGASLVAHPPRPVVVAFFASWCDPCRAELPLLADAARQYAGRVDVRGVDIQDNRDLAAQLLSDSHVGFPSGYDPTLAVGGPWGITGLPVTVFIAAGGSIVDYHRGQLDRSAIDALFASLVARP
jgi:cytochrome c biogenesis protein CcmG/thiol:disulfide interchange protein DsbE